VLKTTRTSAGKKRKKRGVEPQNIFLLQLDQDLLVYGRKGAYGRTNCIFTAA
jgi:hypothetical protein